MTDPVDLTQLADDREFAAINTAEVEGMAKAVDALLQADSTRYCKPHQMMKDQGDAEQRCLIGWEWGKADECRLVNVVVVPVETP